MKYRRLLSLALAYVLTASLSMSVSATELSAAVNNTVSGSDIAETVVEELEVTPQVEESVSEEVEPEEVVQEEVLETFDASQAEIDAMKTVLQLNTTTEGVLSEKSEEDWYSFDITQSGYFQVELKASVNADVDEIDNGWNMYIYKQGDLANAIKVYEKVTDCCQTAPLPMGVGTYYVRIRSNYDYSDGYAPTGCPYEVTANFVASNTWESEYNDTNVTPNTILPNKIYSGIFHHCKDVDWYKVNITTQGYFQLQFTVSNTVNVDDIDDGWAFTIYDKDLNEIRSFYDIKGNYTTPEYPFAKGVFYIKVRADYDYSDGYAPTDCVYNLNVRTQTSSVWESEYNDSNVIADVISPNKKYSGIFHHCKDVDWYKVQVTNKGYFQLQFSVANTINKDDINDGWKIQIYDKDFNEIKSYYDVKSSINSHYFPYAKGTYYVKIAADYDYSDGYAPTNCIYSFQVKSVKNDFWEVEYNNELAKANNITIGKKYSGIFTHCKDEDWYKATVSAAGTLEVKFNKASGTKVEDIDRGWDVYVYQGSMDKQVAKLTGVTSSDSVKLDVKKGKYYIRICPNYNYSDDYAPTNCTYNLTTKFTKAPGAVNLSSAKGGKKQVTLTWKKVANATGYEIYRSTSKNGTYKKVATIKKAATVKYVDKKLKAKTTYYYKIKAYTTTKSLKAYGKFSKVKSAKTSK